MQRHQSTRTNPPARFRALLLLFILSTFINITPAQAQPSTPDNLPSPPHHLLPEGTFIISRQATIIKAGATGAWIVNFKNEPGETNLPPMYLMPSRRLARLEKSLTRQPSDKPLSLIISGQVFVYRNYQFLMLTAVPRLVAPANPTENTPNSETPPTDNTTPNNTPTEKNTTKNQPASPSASAEVEAMIHELETGGPAAPIIRPTTTPLPNVNKKTTNTQNQSATSTPETEPLREGIFINNRLVRMIRSPLNGAWSITFNSDASTLQDPPLIILPCLLLQQMEKRAEQSGDRFQIKISGMVYLYHQGKYILPTAMVIPYKQDNLSP